MNKMVEETVKNMIQQGEEETERIISEKTDSCIVDNAMNRRRLISIRRKLEFWE